MGNKGGESWNSDEKQELEWPWMASFVCSCLSAFIRGYCCLFALDQGAEKRRSGDMKWNFVGVDFGQARDYTAIAVLERAELRGKYDYAVRAYEKEVALRLRYLERI